MTENLKEVLNTFRIQFGLGLGLALGLALALALHFLFHTAVSATIF